MSHEHIFRNEPSGETEYVMMWHLVLGAVRPSPSQSSQRPVTLSPFYRARNEACNGPPGPKARQLECEGTRHKLRD